MIELIVPNEHAGLRLDRYLALALPQFSRSRLQELIRAGHVHLQGKLSRTRERVHADDVVRLIEPPLQEIGVQAEEIPLDLLFEDADLLVINKPAGLVVHPGTGNQGRTLVNALLHHFGKLSAIGGELRPGIVHRLDKATSGLILVAKNDEAHRKLATQFSGRLVKKTYVALVHGWMKQDRGTISSSISRDRVRRTRMTTRRQGGREAITHYTVQRRIDSKFGKFTLLELRIDTGRTHQIRVHLASLGHPVVGDTLYGAPRELRARNGEAAALSRNFLHAVALQFHHPRTGTALSLSSPLPEELSQFLSRVQ